MDRDEWAGGGTDGRDCVDRCISVTLILPLESYLLSNGAHQASDCLQGCTSRGCHFPGTSWRGLSGWKTLKLTEHSYHSPWGSSTVINLHTNPHFCLLCPLDPPRTPGEAEGASGPSQCPKASQPVSLSITTLQNQRRAEQGGPPEKMTTGSY